MLFRPALNLKRDLFHEFLWVQFVAFPQKPTVVWQFYVSFEKSLLILIDRKSMFISFSIMMSRCVSYIKICACVAEVSGIFSFSSCNEITKSPKIASRFPIYLI